MPETNFRLPDKIPWYRYIGPWPFRPVVIFIFAWYFYLVTATGRFIGEQVSDAVEWFYAAIVSAAPASALMAGIIYLGKRWQSKHGVSGLSYAVFITIASISALSVRFLFGAVPGVYSEPGALLIGVLRTAAFIVFTSAVTGAITARLQRQVTATEDALALVRDQQVIMLEADEAARRQVATLLHDRVQAGLIAACLELQMLMTDSEPTNRKTLEAVVERLEALRALDVRRAARALSPDLQDVDLQSALEELASQYEPGMGTKVKVDESLDSQHDDLDTEILLAVYRIVEQALLNAAQHGPAQHVSVLITYTSPYVEITVANDGHEFVGPVDQGLGSAIVTTWTRLFDGAWNLAPVDGGGAVLTARLRTDD